MIERHTEVSVVIPTHNRCDLLMRALGTVLRQDGVDLEVIVCDDGSVDGTVAAVAELKDERIRIARNEVSQGVSAARNLGVTHARGDWVAFLDDDDCWAPSKLRLQLDAADQTNRQWACGGRVMVNADLEVIMGEPPPSGTAIAADLPVRNVVPGGASGVLVRRSVLEQVGGFDTGLRHMSDWDMWIRLAAVGSPAVVPQPIVAYTMHGANASLDNSDVLRELSVIEQRYGRPVDRASVHRWVGSSALRAGARRRALRAYLRAFAAGDRRSLIAAGAALVYPRRRLPRPRPVPKEWRSQAEQWLQPIRATSATPTGGAGPATN